MRVAKSRIAAEVEDDHAVIQFLSSEVRDISTVQMIATEITGVAKEFLVQVVVIDSAKVRHLTSAFLSRPITLDKTLKKEGTQLRLCSMNPEVKRAYEICNLQKVIPLYDSQEAAVAG